MGETLSGRKRTLQKVFLLATQPYLTTRPSGPTSTGTTILILDPGTTSTFHSRNSGVDMDRECPKGQCVIGKTEELLAVLKDTPTTSFPRKRESASLGTWTPACAGVTRRIFISSGGPNAHGNSVESHVIPAKAGIHFLPNVDPRLRGGDVLTFTSMGGPLAHDHSEWRLSKRFSRSL